MFWACASININIPREMIGVSDSIEDCVCLASNDVNDIIDEICLN